MLNNFNLIFTIQNSSFLASVVSSQQSRRDKSQHLCCINPAQWNSCGFSQTGQFSGRWGGKSSHKADTELRDINRKHPEEHSWHQATVSPSHPFIFTWALWWVLARAPLKGKGDGRHFSFTLLGAAPKQIHPRAVQQQAKGREEAHWPFPHWNKGALLMQFDRYMRVGNL